MCSSDLLTPANWSLMRDYVEAGRHRWNTWVLQYSKGRQMALLSDMGWTSPDWSDLLRLCAAMLSVASLLGLAWLWWTRPAPPRNPWHRPLRQVHEALSQMDLPRPAVPAPAPASLWAHCLAQASPPTADAAGVSWPATQDALQAALRQLDAWQYGPQGPERADDVRATVRRIQALARPWQRSST